MISGGMGEYSAWFNAPGGKGLPPLPGEAAISEVCVFSYLGRNILRESGERGCI